jgi:hypothetical protein
MSEIATRVRAEVALQRVRQAEFLKKSQQDEVSRRRNAEINRLRTRLADLEERYRAASVAWENPGRLLRFAAAVEAANPDLTPGNIAYLLKMKRQVVQAETTKGSFLTEESAAFEALRNDFARLGVEFRTDQ